MKILFFAPATQGGHAEYTFELLRGIGQCQPPEWELHLATRQGLPDAYRMPGCQVHSVFPALRMRQDFSSRAAWATSRLTYNVREIQALGRLLRSEAWDIVHFQEISPLFHRGVLRRPRGRTRFIYTVHNVQPHKRLTGGLGAAYDRLTADAWSKFDALLFHSERLKSVAAKTMMNAERKLGVVPHGIWSVPAAPPRSEANGRPVRLLFLGVLRANKGLHLLLDAVARQPGIELAIAGAVTDQRYFDTEIAPRLARLRAAGARITTEFAFLEKWRMIEYLERTDFLVLPYSDFESQSGMLMYAMACGTPVIASEVGALGETVRQHRVGRTYSVAAAEGLWRAIGDATVADSLALRPNVRRYAEEHSWHNVGARHRDVYRAVIAGQPLPGDLPLTAEKAAA